MAFVRHGSPVNIDLINPPTTDALVCRRCGHVLVRSTGDAKIVISPFGPAVICKCGEVANV